MRRSALLLILLAGCTLERRGMEFRCPLHQERLSDDLVPILWGLPFIEKEEAEAGERFFPRAASVYYGGCRPGLESRAWVRYCPLCREAERDWRRSRR